MTEAQRQSRLKSLLPISASQLEVDLMQTFADMIDHFLLQDFGDDRATAIKYLWDPDHCPPQALPHLAAAFSVDTDITQFDITQQRQLIKESFNIHVQKGTVGSIERIIESLGWELDELIEGRRDPVTNAVIRENGGWAQFSVAINTIVPVAQAQAAAKLIQATAPPSRILVAFDFSNVALTYDGGINAEGDYTFHYDGTYTYGSIATQQKVTA